MALGRDHRMPFWLSIATVIRGWAVAEAGEVEAGIEEIRKGMADFAATGTTFLRPFQLGLLAEQHGRNGNLERGLTLIAEALAASERTNERWCDPELHRRQGDLHARAATTRRPRRPTGGRRHRPVPGRPGARAAVGGAAGGVVAATRPGRRHRAAARADRRGPGRHDGPARPRLGPRDPRADG